MSAAPENSHGTALAWEHEGVAEAVLLRGPSGTGKSDLAWRTLRQDPAACLVADDRVLADNRDGTLYLSPPPVLAGLLEVRGLGLVRLSHAEEARARLIVDLVPAADVPRLPLPVFDEIAGVRLPCLMLDAFEGSAPAKLALALASIGLHGFPGADGRLPGWSAGAC